MSPWLFLLLLIYSAVLMLFFLSRELCDLSGDSARYLLLARGLGQGLGYVDMEKPGTVPHTEYGPGLPVLLAPFQQSGKRSLIAGKALMGASLVTCWLMFHCLFRASVPAVPPSTAGFITFALAMMPAYYRLANLVLSDLPYTAVSLAALYYLYCLLNQKEAASAGKWLAAGLLFSLAFFFRQVGVALWPAAALGVLLNVSQPRSQRRRAALWLSVGFLVPVGAWLFRNYLVAASIDPSHFSKLFMARDADPFAGNLGAAGLLARTARGLSDYFRGSSTIFLDMAARAAPLWLRAMVSFLAAAPMLYGFVRRCRQRPGALEWYFIFYLVIICAWQSHNPRYLFPLIPLGLIFLGSAVNEFFTPAAEKLPPARRQPSWKNKIWSGAQAAVILFNLIVLGSDLNLLRRAPVTPPRGKNGALVSETDQVLHDLAGDIKWGYWYQYPDWLADSRPEMLALSYHRLIAASKWMGGNLPESALIMTRKPPLVCWYSGRKSIQYPPLPEPEAFLRFLSQRRVTHLLLDESTPVVRLVVQRILEEKPGILAPVFRLGQTIVLQVKKIEDSA